MKSPGRGPDPSGSTKLTLDNEGLSRKERETDQGFWNLASRSPKTEMGCRLSLVWERGKRGLEEEQPYPCLGGILLTASGETALGEAGSDSRRVEGARLFLAPLVCHTPMWLG